MPQRWTTSFLLPLLSASVIACGDSTGPDSQDLVDVLLDFCSDDTPVFLAVQNEDEDFQRVQPNGEGTFAFQATEQFSLAIVHQDGNTFSTEYVFAAADDIEAVNGVSCPEQGGAKSLTGTVAGVPSGSATMISMASSSDYISAPTSSYSLTGLPSGPLDLVAQREAVSVGGVVPDRVIIRRAQDRTSGSAIPVLDFNSGEAQNVVAHSFTASGVSSSEQNLFLQSFDTPTTRGHSIVPVSSFSSGTNTLYGFPTSLTQAGDLHVLDVFAEAGGSYRGETHFYRTPSTRSVTLGAYLNDPVLTTVGGSSHLRLRTQLTSQSEYGTLLSVAYVQPGREVILTVTNSYFGGTPTQWDVTIPDLSGVTGFPSGALLQNGTDTDWFVDAYGGTAASFFGFPSDGDVLQFAGRAFSTSAAQVAKAGRQERHSSLSRRRGMAAGMGAR